MPTFAAGNLLDPHTGLAITQRTIKVLRFETEEFLRTITTGAQGGYGRFVIDDEDVHAVTLIAGSARVDLVSIEKQLAGGGGAFVLQAGFGVRIDHDPETNTFTISLAETSGGDEVLMITNHGDGTVTYSGTAVTVDGDEFTINFSGLVVSGDGLTFTATTTD